MPIKFVDLAAQNREVKEQIEDHFQRIHEATAYIGGPQVTQFERSFADFIGTAHAVGVASGTDALRLALIAAGVGPGSEVITVSMTFIATATAILQTGARPVFVDVDPDSGAMDPLALARYLEAGRFVSAAGPRAIVPVHLYGLPAPMEQIMDVARHFKLPVIEDACQAHGARAGVDGRWKHAGAIGLAGCFSFYPGKNLGAWGDGGAVTTDDPELAERVARLRDHGRVSHYLHEEAGYNSRLDTLQAAVVLTKLARLEDWNRKRRAIAQRYRELLADCALATPREPEGLESCYHLFVVRSPRRDRILDALQGAGVGCGIHYPVPVHLQPAYKSLGGHKGDFPVSEHFADTVLSLPMHPHLEEAELQTVARTVRAALAA